MRVFPTIVLLLGWLMVSLPSATYAQQTGPPSPVPADTTEGDSLRADSTRVPQTPPVDAPTQAQTPGTDASGDGDLAEPVHLSAADSLIITFDEEDGDMGTLHGEAEMQYDDASLQGPRIDMYFATNELRAMEQASAPNVRPTFQQGNEDAFTGSTLSYNLASGRGRVVSGRRTMNEGFVEGDVTKVFEDSTVFLQNGMYSTCDCPPGETPSYSLRSDQMKVSDKWVYSGPIRLFIFDIPTPFWLPFGFLPNVQGRRSGPIAPEYGEDERGLYLRDMGWYFAMNDYMDLQLQFGAWSQGSYQIRPRFRYAKRYNYRGSLQLNYLSNRSGESEDPNFAQNRQGRLQWDHEQTISPTSTFNSNLDLVTSSNLLRNSSEDYNDNVRQEVSSGMRYSKRWTESGRRINLSVDHRQNFANNSVSTTLPNLSFSQPSFKPFESDESTAQREQRWYERITFNNYRLNVRNRYDFQPLSGEDLIDRGDPEAAEIDWYEALFSPSKYRRATGRDEPFDFEASHSTGLNMPFNLPRYRLNLSPNVSYSEDWYIRTVRKRLADSTETGGDPEVVDESVPGFFARREFNTGISANTTFYGLFPVGVGAYQGLRHTARPSLSFSYRPDFNTDFWGYTRTYTDAQGETVRYDILSGRTIGRSSRQQSLSFSLNNTFETKRVRVDSTGAEQSRTLRLLNLDLSSSYNFAADSLKLSDIRLRGRTDVFEEFDVSFQSTFSPYALGPEGRIIDRYQIQEPGLGLARLTNLRLTLRTSLDGGETSTPQTSTSPQGGMAPGGAPPPDADLPNTGPPGNAGPQQGRNASSDTGPQLDPYANFSIPWSVDLNFNYGLRRTGTQTNRDATLGASFSFSPTPMWRITGQTGYDFVDWDFSTTRVSINRDLGCWVMSFNWTPFGQFQSYGFSLRVKSGPVQDLLNLRLPQSGRSGFFDNVQRQASGSIPGGGF